MKEFRITLISDPTDKYPHNKNNNFKVRLPVLPNLEGNQWQASLWSLSVADVGQSPAVINTNNDVTLLKYRYTFTSRYQDTSNDWLIGFQAKGKTVTLKKKMGTSYPVTSGIQLWHNIVTHMEQTMMEDLNASSAAWKASKNNAATISLKSTWKPTFEWKEDTLILKGVPHEDVYARDAQLNVQPLSSVGFHVDLAEKFGLLFKDKPNQYQLGPNLDYVFPKVSYSDRTPPTRSNQRYQWLGDHFVGITPRDVLGGNALFKVKIENGQSYLSLILLCGLAFSKPQFRVRHQRCIGRHNSPYQRGGTIFSPRNPWAVTSYQPYGVDPMILCSLRQRAKRKGGKVHKVTYPWMIKGRKRIKSDAHECKLSVCQHFFESV